MVLKGFRQTTEVLKLLLRNLTPVKKPIKYIIMFHGLVESSKFDDSAKTFKYNGAMCFNIKALDIGPAKAIFYDLDALKWCISYIKKNNIQNRLYMYWLAVLDHLLVTTKRQLKN